MAMMIRVFPSSRKKVKREKNKGTLVVGADNAMGISMTITEQVCLSSSNLSDLAQCLTVNQKSRILRIFAAFCGILRHVNEAHFARNVKEWDFFCVFQTLCFGGLGVPVCSRTAVADVKLDKLDEGISLCVLWLTLTGLQPWWSIRHLLSAFLHW